MAFRENFAAGRKDPNSGPEDFPTDSASGASNQEQSQSRSTKARTVSLDSKHDTGHLAQMQANVKGTGVVGVPVSAAFTSRSYTLGANENPDGKVNRP